MSAPFFLVPWRNFFFISRAERIFKVWLLRQLKLIIVMGLHSEVAHYPLPNKLINKFYLSVSAPTNYFYLFFINTNVCAQPLNYCISLPKLTDYINYAPIFILRKCANCSHTFLVRLYLRDLIWSSGPLEWSFYRGYYMKLHSMATFYSTWRRTIDMLVSQGKQFKKNLLLKFWEDRSMYVSNLLNRY